MKEGLRASVKAGYLPRRAVDGLAHLMFGALCEGAMYIARAGDQRAALGAITRDFKTLLDSLARSRGGVRRGA